MTNRIKAQLNNFRKLIGGGLALAGFGVLGICAYTSLANWPLVVLGLAFVAAGILIASSRTVYELINF